MQEAYITELVDLFKVIDREVDESRIPKKQHNRIAKQLKTFAQSAFELGKNGSCKIQLSKRD